MPLVFVDLPAMPDPPEWLQVSLAALGPDNDHKQPARVRRSLLARDAAALVWRELHDASGMSEREMRWLYRVLLFFSTYPRANDQGDQGELRALIDEQTM